jgi:predicted PurR-regulated permease PerM
MTLLRARGHAADVDADPPVRLAAPSLKAVVRMVAIVVACALALYVIWRLRDVVRLVLISLFLALALLPLVDADDARVRVPRAAVILALYAALAGGVLVAGAVVVPSMAKQVARLSNEAPRYADDLRRNDTFRRYDDRYHITASLRREAQDLPGSLARATGPLQRVTVKAFAVIGQFVTVLAVAFVLMLNGRRYVGIGLRLTGTREPRYRKLVIDINGAVARYMLGNIAISVLATVTTWLVLTILGVPYGLSLGIVVGFFDLIPLVGATIGAIVVALATLTVDFPTATIIWIAFVIVYQRFENYLVQPLVYGKALDVNPLVTILGVLAGASLLGVLGALLAIPVAAAVQIILRALVGLPRRGPRAAIRRVYRRRGNPILVVRCGRAKRWHGHHQRPHPRRRPRPARR